MPLTALERLQVDLADIVYAAGQIQRVLGRPATKRDLEHAAYEVIDFRDTKLRPHLEFQAETLLAVAQEHMGRIDILDAIDQEVTNLEVELGALVRAVELGQPLRLPLEASELALRDYVDHQERVALPSVKGILGELLLREVEHRIEADVEPDIDSLDIRI